MTSHSHFSNAYFTYLHVHVHVPVIIRMTTVNKTLKKQTKWIKIHQWQATVIFQGNLCFLRGQLNICSYMCTLIVLRTCMYKLWDCKALLTIFLFLCSWHASSSRCGTGSENEQCRNSSCVSRSGCGRTSKKTKKIFWHRPRKRYIVHAYFNTEIVIVYSMLDGQCILISINNYS